MRHLGDIRAIHGDKVEAVDCVIGGSPCQDMSVAGKRAGLSGARSGLFMEQIRIVREMRKRYGKPRYMVWENVPGAFSSNKGEDFRVVLEETARVVDESVSVPRPPKDKWAYAGCIMGDGYSIAWRTHDAQFWGVPQRRRRIALVADFGGESAPEILFEREGLRGNTETGGNPRKRAAGGAENGSDQTVWYLQGNGIGRADTAGCDGRGWREDISYTLNTVDRPAVCYDMTHANDVIRDCGEVSPTLQSRMGTGGNQIPLCIGNGQIDQLYASDKVGALDCMHDQKCVMSDSVIRRLTPLECERLQGLPDGWTNIGDWVDSKGKKHRDADMPRYKAIGNSIAIPFWLWMLRRMSEYLPDRATMGSLFDGIGAFPLCWEIANGTGTARWASEIEEFPIAVTKFHFPEDDNE